MAVAGGLLRSRGLGFRVLGFRGSRFRIWGQRFRLQRFEFHFSLLEL